MNQWVIIAAAGTLLVFGWVYVAILFYKLRKADRSYDELHESATKALQDCADGAERLADALAETAAVFTVFGNTAVEIMDTLDLSEVSLESQVMFETSWERVPPFIKANMDKVAKFFRDRNPPFVSPPPEDKKPPERDGKYYD